MDNEKYTPHPADLSKVVLPEEMNAIVETIAKNVHEVWAEGRIKDGWTYGPVRNDALKRTPCLIPYDALPESEKEFDRNTAMNSIKLIVSLGYKISK